MRHGTHILHALVTYRTLTTSQCYTLLGADGESAKRLVRYALRRLAVLGLIHREELLKRASSDSLRHWEFIATLSEQGLAEARSLGLDPHRRGTAARPRSPFILEHEAQLSEFHLLLKPPYWRQTDLAHDLGAYKIDPDALFYFNRFYFFLEIERNGAGDYLAGDSSRLRKIRNYCAYADRSARPFQRKWPTMNDFYVTVVIDGETRRDNFLRLLQVRYPVRRVLLATMMDCRREIRGHIWRSPKAPEARVSLSEL